MKYRDPIQGATTKTDWVNGTITVFNLPKDRDKLTELHRIVADAVNAFWARLAKEEQQKAADEQAAAEVA